MFMLAILSLCAFVLTYEEKFAFRDEFYSNVEASDVYNISHITSLHNV